MSWPGGSSQPQQARLAQALHDKKIEEHRTDAIEYRAHVHHELALLQGLLDKLNRP